MKLPRIRDLPPRAVLAVLALALIASVVSGREKRDLTPEPAPAAKAAVRVAAADAAPNFDPGKLKRPTADTAITDLFAPDPGSAPSAERAQSAPPSAPPLPFRYLGKIIDGDQTAVFLIRGNDHYSITAGQLIDRTYRIERITDTAITITYLPLGTRQILPVQAPN